MFFFFFDQTEFTAVSPFDAAKHIDDNGNEYWLARELMPMLGYKKWSHFKSIIRKSQNSCELSENVVSDHFADVGKMIQLAKNAYRTVPDYQLSRYAC